MTGLELTELNSEMSALLVGMIWVYREDPKKVTSCALDFESPEGRPRLGQLLSQVR